MHFVDKPNANNIVRKTARSLIVAASFLAAATKYNQGQVRQTSKFELLPSAIVVVFSSVGATLPAQNSSENDVCRT